MAKPDGRRTRRTLLARQRVARVLLIGLLVLMLGGRQVGPEPVAAPNPPMVGFSFSPYAVPQGTDPLADFQELLDRLQPDVVRLPVYWSDVMPAPGALDFSQTDALVAAVENYNHGHLDRPCRIILVVGVRNIGYPEVWAPPWLDRHRLANLSALVQSPEFITYFQSVVARYAADPSLTAWQVENEPFDNVTSGVASPDVSLSTASVRSELQRLALMDSSHPAVVTTYDSATVQLDLQATSDLSWLYNLLPGPKPVGHPEAALSAANILGMDAYVVTPTTPLDQASAQIRMAWKAGALDYWAQQALNRNKPFWITEMQASAWLGGPTFTPHDLVQSAHVYSQIGASLILLWGVESWIGQDAWIRSGATALQVLRGTPTVQQGAVA